MKLTSSQPEVSVQEQEYLNLELGFKPVDLRTDSLNMVIKDILAMPQKLAVELSVQQQEQVLVSEAV